METPQLASSEYWESEAVDIRLNPRRGIEATGLREFLEQECGVRAAVVMATSGSSGGFKFVVLPKSAMLTSAKAVAEYGDLQSDDIWLAGLSDFHVGGLGVFARAYVVGSQVEAMSDPQWRLDGIPFLDALDRSKATLTSLTPTHLHDLVKVGAKSPRSLRGVYLGGGPIDAKLIERAREIGWNIWPSYGMTEACSQIATSIDGETKWLPILPHWECRTSRDERLEIRGDALFSGYALKDLGEWRFTSGVNEEGWFVTGDRCELADGNLRFVGRADDLVKVSGELVSLSAIERVASLDGFNVAVVAFPSERRGNDLVAFVEEDGSDFLEALNHRLDGIEKVSRVISLESLPRTEIGKIDRKTLRELAEADYSRQPTG